MAKVVRLHEFGGPEVLRVEELDVGEPGPDEVRICVGAIGLNRAEAQYRSGSYLPATFPSKIGYDAAGIVEAVGEGVTCWKPGDRVATLTGTSMEQYGTYGEQILFPADLLANVPDGMSLTEGAAIWMQYFTAYPIVGVAGVQEGDHVIITAASSSVGLAAIQIANANGAVPIAVTRGRSKADALRKHGAAHVVVSGEEDIAQRIWEITGGAGARIAFDAVGGTTLSAIAGAMRSGGFVIYYGILGGLPQDFPWVNLISNNLTIRGFAAYVYTLEPQVRRHVIDYVLRNIACGAFHPVIDRVFEFDEVVAAHHYLESNTQFGKIVVTTASAEN